MDQRDLDKLLQDASRGSEPAIEELFARNLPDLKAFFRMRLGRRIRSRESDTDLVQSVCREVLQDLDQVDDLDAESFRRWLFTTANRKMADKQRFYAREMRRGEREAGAIDEDFEHSRYADLLTPSEIAMGREAHERFERAFDALSAEQRLVLTGFKLLGQSHAELGEEIGKSAGAVRMILHRALARIGRVLEQPNSGD
ncbi:MAG: RNA polymerase sigma factor [bacterium]|nr:RNA polymerase sigma factor [bacterium]